MYIIENKLRGYKPFLPKLNRKQLSIPPSKPTNEEKKMEIISKETSPLEFRVTSENNTKEVGCIISLKQLESSVFGDKYLPGARAAPTVTTQSGYHGNTLRLPG
jgi:hypothetical protein